MSFFENVAILPEDLIFSTQAAFLKDPAPKKANLGIGAYRDAEGNPLVFLSVRKAEAQLLEKHLYKEYLPILGAADYISETAKLIFGADHTKLTDGSITGAQTVGGSAAIRIGGEFLSQSVTKNIYIPNLTWPNHKLLLSRAGLKVDNYPYYNFIQSKFDFGDMCEGIKKIPTSSALLLQGTSHNPTGLNPSLEQWKMLSSLMKEKHLIPFFDIAYQGFGTGIEEDVQPLQLFLNDGHDMLVSQTYCKNMGLYGERTGSLFVVTQNKKQADASKSHIQQLTRGMYSNPPLHGERIVTTVLQSESLRSDWVEELTNVRKRTNEMRRAFVTGLLSKGSNAHFEFLNLQFPTGMFAYLNLTSEQEHRLKQQFSIYLIDGRINIAGLNWKNMDYVIDAIVSV